jgi:hypothetical protein
MKQKIFYVVRGQFYRAFCKTNDPVILFKVFKNENSAKAREATFTYFQDYVDLMLLAKSRTYTNYKLAVELLQDFFNSYSLDDALNDTNSDVFNDLTLSMVTNGKLEYRSKDGTEFYKDEFVIHGIHKNSNDFDVQMEYFKNLRLEAEIYEKRKLPLDTEIVEYDISPLFGNPVKIKLLRTPIDFNEMITDLVLTNEKL